MFWLEDFSESHCPAPRPAPALPPEDSTFSDTTPGPLNGPDTQHTIANHQIFEENPYCDRDISYNKRRTNCPTSPQKTVFKNPVDELNSRMGTAEGRLRKLTGGIEKSSQK